MSWPIIKLKLIKRTPALLILGLASTSAAYASETCRIEAKRLEEHATTLSQLSAAVERTALECRNLKLSHHFSMIQAWTTRLRNDATATTAPFLDLNMANNARVRLTHIGDIFREMVLPLSGPCVEALRKQSEDAYAAYRNTLRTVATMVGTTYMACPEDRPYCNNLLMLGMPADGNSTAPICGDPIEE